MNYEKFVKYIESLGFINNIGGHYECGGHKIIIIKEWNYYHYLGHNNLDWIRFIDLYDLKPLIKLSRKYKLRKILN